MPPQTRGACAAAWRPTSPQQQRTDLPYTMQLMRYTPARVVPPLPSGPLAAGSSNLQRGYPRLQTWGASAASCAGAGRSPRPCVRVRGWGPGTVVVAVAAAGVRLPLARTASRPTEVPTTNTDDIDCDSPCAARAGLAARVGLPVRECWSPRQGAPAVSF